MQRPATRTGNRGSSQVVGLVLVVGVTLVLATTVATFALDVGRDLKEIAPAASFEFEYEADADCLRVTHHSGDAIEPSRLVIEGVGITTGTPACGNAVTAAGTSWPVPAASGSATATTVQTGDSIDVGVTPSYEVRLVWRRNDSGSVRLASSEGPER